jgi:hypothetical protein
LLFRLKVCHINVWLDRDARVAYHSTRRKILQHGLDPLHRQLSTTRDQHGRLLLAHRPFVLSHTLLGY